MRYISTFAIVFIGITSAIGQDAPTGQSNMDEMKKQLELTKPGKEHEELKRLTGNWKVTVELPGNQKGPTKSASAKTILGDRFLVVDGSTVIFNKPTSFRYTIGFDRRNTEYEISLRDDSGTYSVIGRGKRKGDTARVVGNDNDPFMKKMGIDKKFAFDMKFVNEDEFSIATVFVDNRTEVEKYMVAYTLKFSRDQ